MKYGEILSQGALPGTLRAAARARARGFPFVAAPVSRRRFLRSAAGVTACGAAIGSPFFLGDALAASAPGIGLVVPIPSTIPVFGDEIHVQAPPFTGEDTDPSSVYHFFGAAGIAFISGTVERTDRRTGESRTLPYSFNDMRFMQGQFRGQDGHVRQGTFVFT
jgi:hypothetical protein